MTSLHIPNGIYSAMISHVQVAYPLEACGILAGQNGRLCHHYPIANRLSSPTAYEMDPQQQIEAMLAIEANKWEMAAIYHSHPNSPAYPSPTDVAQAYYPDTIQIIISLQLFKNPVVRGYQIIDGQITAVFLQIE